MRRHLFRELLEAEIDIQRVSDVPPDVARKYAAYTAEQAPGAMLNGTRVIKVRTDPDDTHDIGAGAKILGSVDTGDRDFGYFVEWDDMPGLPVFVIGWKLEREKFV